MTLPRILREHEILHVLSAFFSRIQNSNVIYLFDLIIIYISQNLLQFLVYVTTERCLRELVKIHAIRV